MFLSKLVVPYRALCGADATELLREQRQRVEVEVPWRPV
jgi:hypothetical protein